MGDIIFEKTLHDDNLVILNITATSELARARQRCYINSESLFDYSKTLCSYALSSEKECYVQIGEKEWDMTPMFSMKIIRTDKLGHVVVEVDVGIEDDETWAHRCCFYVGSDIGAIERFGLRIGKLEGAPVGTVISLNKDNILSYL